MSCINSSSGQHGFPAAEATWGLTKRVLAVAAAATVVAAAATAGESATLQDQDPNQAV
jgi:hypothetical protein